MASRTIGGGISKPSSRGGAASSTSAASSSTTASSVRRNLFQSQLLRRPTSSSTGTSTSAETLRLSNAADIATAVSTDDGPTKKSPELPNEEDSGIVVRNKNGEIEYNGDPPTPEPIDHDADEGSAAAAAAQDAMRHEEHEKERQRLAEAVRQHQIDQNSVPAAQPEELLEAVRASMRAKVAALAEDNWMYEREELPRFR
ncbi:hypothetical protein QBC46DRAFT_370023 [Diplogelasinospora grovesii]|uniref:Uncharacterized protein n=1 Tax=Diplogelasinospora grovesii TaxID=303347 RepID=A0AAN6NJ84_9PEZI|nr:hypothetical protein QBC46DRAFT_370023 [Diplogelasinospora grovesii]